MRQPELIHKELQMIDEIYQTASDLSRKFPEDTMLLLKMEQTLHRRLTLIDELGESVRHQSAHVLKVSIDRAEINNDYYIIARHLPTVLNSFHSLYEASLRDMGSIIYFSSDSFSAEFGTMPSSDKRFLIESEKSIKNTYEALHYLSSFRKGYNVKDFMQSCHINDFIVYENLIENILKLRAGFELNWHSPVTGMHSPINIDPVQILKLYKTINKKKVLSSEIIDISGSITKLKNSNVACFVVDYGAVHSNEIGVHITGQQKKMITRFLGTKTTAKIKMVREYYEYKQAEETKYTLIDVGNEGDKEVTSFSKS